MASDGTLTFDTSLDTSGLQKGTSGLGDVAKNALGVFTGNLMTKATEAVVNLGKEALSSGMSFESSMQKVKTLFTGTDEQFSALSDEILEISSATGLAADGLAEAAYSAESAGVPMEMLGTMLQSSAELAAAGFTDIDTALSATAKTMNAYGMEGEEAIGRVQKVLMQTQNLGITTVDELGASLAQVTPTASAFGVSFEQVGASLAVMTASGTSTAQATTQLNSLIAELGKTGTVASNNLAKAAEGTQYAGMSFNEMMEAGADLGDVLGMISAQADKDGVSMVDMFSSIEAGKAALSIFSGEGETFKSDLEQMATSADVVGEAYGTVSDSLEFKTQRIKTAFSNMATGLFEVVSGPLADAADGAADALASITQGFNENGVAGVADALMGLFENAAQQIMAFDWGGTADKIVAGITEFIEGNGTGRFLETASNIVVSIAQGLGQAVPKLLPALVKLVAHIVTNLIKQAPKLINAGLQLIANLAVGLVQALPEIGAAIWQIITALADAWSQLPGIIGDYYNTLLSGIGQWCSDMWAKASEGMSNLVNGIVSWIQQLPERVWTWLVNTVTKLLEWRQQMIMNATQAMSEMLSGIISWVQQLPERVWTWLVNTVTKLLAWRQQMITNASTAMSEMISKIVSWLQQLPGKVWTWLVNTANKVVQWGIQLAQKGAAAAKKLFDSVVDGIKGLPDKIMSIGADIVTGLWNGISSGWDWLKDEVSGLATSLLDAAKDALGINSPSTEFRDQVGRWGPPGIAEGFDEAMPDALKDMEDQAEEMVASMQAAVSSNMRGFSITAGSSATLKASNSMGTTVYNDNHVEQENTYNVPVATPSETAKAQREAVRNLVGGVK